MNGNPYDPTQQPSSQQGYGYQQQPYGNYQQNSYTGYQQPVGQVNDAAAQQGNAYQSPFPQQNTGYQQTGYQQAYQQTGYQQPYQQDNGQQWQQPYQQDNAQQWQQPYQQDNSQQWQQPYQQDNAQQWQQPYQQDNGQQWQQPYQQDNGQQWQQPYQQDNGQQWQQPYQQDNAQQWQLPSNNYPYQVGGVPHMQQPQPVQKPPVDVDGITRLVVYLMLPVLLVLFILGMVFGGAIWLKWVFIGLSLAMIGVVWARPLLLQNDLKITVSCIFLALSLVAGVSAVFSSPADTTNVPGNVPGSNVNTNNQQNPAGQQNNIVVPMPGTSEQVTLTLTATPVPTATPAPESSGLESEAVQRLTSFLYFWSVNDTENMLSLCAPSWVRAQSNAMVSLFGIQANRKPSDYTATAITGTDNDVSRTVSVNMYMSRYDDKAPEKYAFKVVMLKENDMWFVDPQSLQSNEKIVTQAPSAEITQPPTPAPVADSNAVLYYNPNGGSRYHIDAYCKSTNAKYLPFSGTFTYGELTNAPYSSLTACNVCGAPLRPGE